jgi:transcriptional regulator with XRE-family HTH domain
MTSILKVVAFNVRRRRDALKLKQDQVADKAGISRPAVARVENASNPGLKILDIVKIAEALRCKASDLLDEPKDHALLCRKATLNPGPCDCGFETYRRITDG